MKSVWLSILTVLALGTLPLAAQGTNAGPVHVPNGYGANTSTPAAPVPDPSPAIAPTSPPPPGAAAPSQASADDGGDIRDIRGPISIPYPFIWALDVLAAALAGGLLYLLWRWLHRTTLKPKLPHEIALERLEAARAMMTESQVRDYAFAVSEVIRTYIEQRFGERAARRTTEEFLNDLVRRTGTPLSAHRGLLEDFLHHCDLPKFARWQLSVPEMEAMHRSARTFITETQPGALPAPPLESSPAPVAASP